MIDDPIDELEPSIDESTLHALAPPNPQFRSRLRAETSRFVRRSASRRRWALKGAGLASAYAAGCLTVWLSFGGPSEPTSIAAPNPIAAPPTTETPAAATVVAPPADDALDDAPPYVLEHKASLAEAHDRLRLLRLAGDKYIDEIGDIASAARCYSALVRAWPAATPPAPDEPWLLQSLRRNHVQEIRHDSREG